ncbi:unnamed protein product [Caenorhabditis nigoni]
MINAKNTPSSENLIPVEQKPEKSINSEISENPKSLKKHWLAKESEVWRDEYGTFEPGRCDTWQEIETIEAHWWFFYGSLFLIGFGFISAIFTIYFGTFDQIDDSSSLNIPTIHFVEALIGLIHVWCILRFALMSTNRFWAFKAIFGISIFMAVLCVGIGLFATFFVGKSYLILVYYLTVSTTLAVMSFVIFEITFRIDSQKLSTRKRGYLRKLADELREQEECEP